MKNTKNTIPYEGKSYIIFTVNTDFGTFDVICVPREYGNGTLAIEMISVENGSADEPFTVLTVNLDNPFTQSDTRAYLDTNNNPWAEKFVKTNRIAKDEYITDASGYCRYPLYSFNLSRLTA